MLGCGKGPSAGLLRRTLYRRRYCLPPCDKVAELYGAAGFRVERIGDIGDAVRAALGRGKPAVVDIAVDPAALYGCRRDSFKHQSEKR
jgi:acetolactate synthase-1/2/3 large subunit/sulfoacetaldehyde acetyltransferase